MPLFQIIGLVWIVPFLHIKIGLGTAIINGIFDYVNKYLEKDSAEVILVRKKMEEDNLALRRAVKNEKDNIASQPRYDEDMAFLTNAVKLKKLYDDAQAKKKSQPNSKGVKGWDAQMSKHKNELDKLDKKFVPGTNENGRLLQLLRNFEKTSEMLAKSTSSAKANFQVSKAKLSKLLEDRKNRPMSAAGFEQSWGRQECVPP